MQHAKWIPARRRIEGEEWTSLTSKNLEEHKMRAHRFVTPNATDAAIMKWATDNYQVHTAQWHGSSRCVAHNKKVPNHCTFM